MVERSRKILNSSVTSHWLPLREDQISGCLRGRHVILWVCNHVIFMWRARGRGRALAQDTPT